MHISCTSLDMTTGLASLSSWTSVACRDAVKKAVESLRAATSATCTPSSHEELLNSLSSLEKQLQAVLPETLPAVLEGMHSVCCSAFIIQCPIHKDCFKMTHMFSSWLCNYILLPPTE